MLWLLGPQQWQSKEILDSSSRAQRVFVCCLPTQSQRARAADPACPSWFLEYRSWNSFLLFSSRSTKYTKTLLNCTGLAARTDSGCQLTSPNPARRQAQELGALLEPAEWPAGPSPWVFYTASYILLQAAMGFFWGYSCWHAGAEYWYDPFPVQTDTKITSVHLCTYGNLAISSFTSLTVIKIHARI